MSTLRWQGRRQGFRRAGEGRHAYVDGLARRTVVLALFVFGASLLDALLTLLHLALVHGPTRFLQVKISLTGVGVCVLAAHDQVPLAQRGLYGLTLSYGVVLLVHLALVLRLV